jgi:phthiodiolone/phenolphthiodiolone dimycocerosates ketoreductase
MSRFRIGLATEIFNARHSPTALARAGYLSALAGRIDSFWVPDHLNALLPRAIATPQYLGAAKLVPKIDAYLEPWTMLGHIASWNRLGRRRLGIGVTDAGRRNPAVTAQAAATLHLLTRGRGTRRQPTLRGGLVQTGGPVRRGHCHDPCAVGLGR